MKLSVIIVNYNVKYFLEQCLHAVQKALHTIDGEIIVVDNNSVDGSCEMVAERFPSVHLISNKTNTGFSKANNQGIKLAQGEYVLLLNPDTVVEENCFEKCLNFMDRTTQAGALGVKMIDGNGRFLPESKRGLPTPAVAFYKIFGLTRLFPKSKKFARYYLGHLDDQQTNKVEVLAGAFMLIRQKALDKAGLLDEHFFMYGEDIDLSYRITKAGYDNYYFPETTIIHYKGESTKKGSLNYVKLFYKAMLIFANKHFSGKQSRLFSLVINLAVYFRALLSIFSRAMRAAILPILDAILILVGFYLITPAWENFQFTAGHFPSEFLQLVAPAYALIWLISLAVSGAYRKRPGLAEIIRGVLVGGFAIIILYSFLNEEWRFSRAITLLGFCWTLLIIPAERYLMQWLFPKYFRLQNRKNRKVILVANHEEVIRITELLQLSSSEFHLIGSVSSGRTEEKGHLGTLDQLQEVVSLYQPDELIFSGEDIDSSAIIDAMLLLNTTAILFKIAPQAGSAIIGSHSPETAGDLYKVVANPISSTKNKWLKRWLDLKIACLILILFPISVFLFKPYRKWANQSWLVLQNKKTWISYASSPDMDEHLPPLKTGVLTTCSGLNRMAEPAKKLALDRHYAKNYRILNDLNLIWRNRKNLMP